VIVTVCGFAWLASKVSDVGSTDSGTGDAVGVGEAVAEGATVGEAVGVGAAVDEGATVGEAVGTGTVVGRATVLMGPLQLAETIVTATNTSCAPVRRVRLENSTVTP
jgi:hypothetical protein